MSEYEKNNENREKHGDAYPESDMYGLTSYDGYLEMFGCQRDDHDHEGEISFKNYLQDGEENHEFEQSQISVQYQGQFQNQTTPQNQAVRQNQAPAQNQRAYQNQRPAQNQMPVQNQRPMQNQNTSPKNAWGSGSWTNPKQPNQKGKGEKNSFEFRMKVILAVLIAITWMSCVTQR